MGRSFRHDLPRPMLAPRARAFPFFGLNWTHIEIEATDPVTGEIEYAISFGHRAFVFTFECQPCSEL
jgi:hypothetical protein